jgi:hypothetical protein
VVLPCMCQLGALSSCVGAWSPRDGVRSAAEVPAISLAWWRMMRRVMCCRALLTVSPCLRQLGTLSSGTGYAVKQMYCADS